MFQDIKCQSRQCRNKILRLSGDGHLRFSIKALIAKGENAQLTAVCRDCGEENVLPYALSPVAPVSSDDKETVQKSKPRRVACEVTKGGSSDQGGFLVIRKSVTKPVPFVPPEEKGVD